MTGTTTSNCPEGNRGLRRYLERGGLLVASAGAG